MSSSFIQHVTFLNQNSIQKLIACLLCPSRLSSSCDNDSSFMSLNRHEISRYLVSNGCGFESSISDVVHVKVMSIVDKEMQSIFSIFWCLNTRNFDGFVDSLFKCLHRFIKLSNQIYVSMLLIFSFQSLNFISLVLHCLHLLLNVNVMLQDLDIRFTLVFLAQVINVLLNLRLSSHKKLSSFRHILTMHILEEVSVLLNLLSFKFINSLS